MRGSDIKYNPVFFAYLIVTKNSLRFFVNSSKLPKDFDMHQIKNEVEITVNSYESIGKELTQIVSIKELYCFLFLNNYNNEK